MNVMTDTQRASRPEQARRLGLLARLIFGSRWLQLPLYLGLIVAQCVYIALFIKELWHLSWHALDLTEQQMQSGYVSYLALLSAQSSYSQAVLTRVQAQASRLGDTVALFQALGGGWWKRSTVPGPVAQELR